MNPNDASIRKRVQIAKTNKMMFLWIAIASAIVGMAVVVSIFLAQRLVYNEKVLAKKQETITTLEANLDAVDTLKEEILKLDANSALLATRAGGEDQAIQVILDALPSEANSLALGASLQKNLLNGIDGLTLESLSVTPVQGVEVVDDSSVVDESSTTGDGSNSISFSFTVTGDQNATKQALLKLEKSIRTIEIVSLRIDGGSDGITEMTVDGRAFYEPEKTLELTEEPV